MITIDQLLESVDLDFEPRWVTKDEDGCIWVWNTKPTKNLTNWQKTDNIKNTTEVIGFINIAEFDGKDWSECIYEVPRKTTGKIEKITGVFSTVNGKRKIVFPSDVSQEDIISKLHEVIDAVNELKGAKNE
ncbi:MAG: hypothetical protein II208_04455 [Alphaproteobacteria bacterium]|nr:hypothetical protein [Alphaproteobacteria bacterium]